MINENDIHNLLINMGFVEVLIKGERVYKYNNDYYKFTYIKKFESYVIEYAIGEEEALKNRYDDGDLYPISLGKEKFLKLLKEDLIKYYIE